MTRKRYEQPTLLLRVMAELGAGRVFEGRISDKSGCIVEGICEDSGTHQITVDPAWPVVSTLLHELLHRLYPQWSERYVRNREKYLMNSLTQAQVAAIHDEYQRRKRKRSRPVTIEA